MRVCDCCRALGADIQCHLCDKCFVYYEEHIKFIGDWTERDRQKAYLKMFCSDAFDSADRAHGVILINGVPRFIRDDLTRALANNIHTQETYLAKKFYRNYGYSLDEYEQIFCSKK